MILLRLGHTLQSLVTICIFFKETTGDILKINVEPESLLLDPQDENFTKMETIILTQQLLKFYVKSFTNLITKEMNVPNYENNTNINIKMSVQEVLDLPALAIRKTCTGFGNTIKRGSVCNCCQVFVGVLIHQIRVIKANQSRFIKFSTLTCTFLKLAQPEVCAGIVERMGPTFYWIIQQRQQMAQSIICGLMFQSLGCQMSQKSILGSDFEWNVDLLRKPGYANSSLVPRPVVLVSSSQDFRNPDTLKKDKNIQMMKIVHLADLHIDYNYAPGTKTVCDNEILCCQKANGYAKKNETAAGFFGGTNKCDAPINILHSALEHIRNTHGNDVDLIYMTGDLVPHNIWYSTVEENTKTIQSVSQVIYDYFPTATIIPCLGNHEPHIANNYSPTSRTFGTSDANPLPREIQTDWVYEVAYESWRQWIPPDQKETFLNSGNYAVEINSKFRVLVVNTNVCYGFNMWQLYNPQDPGGQLEWLQKQLELTEHENKTAHIIGHVPPGHEDCFKTWSREFYKIIVKYRKTVRAQFYGHTHYDEFRILHDPIFKTDPINVMWIGPSLTPYRTHNPGYRVYHVDLGHVSIYGDVMDHETWIYDLEKVNKEHTKNFTVNHRAVPWFKLYQATEAYQIKNLLPANLKQFVVRMAKNRTTFDLFYKFYFKAVDTNHQKQNPCDKTCQKQILCGMVQAYYDDDDGQVECASIQKEIDGVVLKMRDLLKHRNRFNWF